MTSLKVKYADEIAEAMAATLGDEEFVSVFRKEASVMKMASQAFNDFYKEFTTNPPVDGLAADSLYRKYEGGMEGAEKEKAKEIIKAKFQAPGESVPPPADDQSAEDADDRFAVAADFALSHLAKIADALDNQGFAKIADVIDETMQKLAEKKRTEAKGKKEKPPKGAVHKAPKGWFDKMKADVKKKNPDYSAKRINETVGDVWDNELSDKKREQICKQYGKTKSPNK